uniref:FMRFamide neuropeptide n=1 Tax=Steinernema glaseri TaxID=37863 RepID=A0A1I7Z363_9BILA
MSAVSLSRSFSVNYLPQVTNVPSPHLTRFSEASAKPAAGNELEEDDNDDVRYLLSVVDEWPQIEGVHQQRSIRSPLGTMRFGKRDPLGTMRFGKRATLGTMRFGKRDPLGTMRFGKRVPLGTMRFGKRDPLGTMRFGKKRDPLGTMRFGKRASLGTMRFGKRSSEEPASFGQLDGKSSFYNSEEI